MGYLNFLNGGYKKVIERLMYYSLPTKCFYEDILSNILQVVLSECLLLTFLLILIKF